MYVIGPSWVLTPKNKKQKLLYFKEDFRPFDQKKKHGIA